MSVIYTILHGHASGFVNQVFYLVSAILKARQYGLNTVVVDNFYNHFTGTETTPAKAIFDLETMSKHLQFSPQIVCRSEWPEKFPDNPCDFFMWPCTSDIRSQFDDIVRIVTFHPQFVERAQTYASHLSNLPKLDVVHLKVEHDAVAHYAKFLNCEPHVYKDALTKKYISLIDKYLNPSNAVLVLGYGENNDIVQHLIQTHEPNKVFYVAKNADDGREISALIDFLVCEMTCSGTFIGPTNMDRIQDTYQGSSFTYALMTRMSNAIQKVGFSPENLAEVESVSYLASG